MMTVKIQWIGEAIQTILRRNPRKTPMSIFEIVS
jgi:hypothetical protein